MQLECPLRALQERDTAVERWLIKEVVGVYDAMQENPDRAISSEDLFPSPLDYECYHFRSSVPVFKRSPYMCSRLSNASGIGVLIWAFYQLSLQKNCFRSHLGNCRE